RPPPGGADVLLVARSADALADAAEECGDGGGEAQGRAAPLALDVTAPGAGERIVAEASERFGQLDVLVNNAGTARRRDLEDVPDEDWQAGWGVNAMGPPRAVRGAGPGGGGRGRG